MLSAIAVDHVQSPRNIGPLDDALFGASGEPGEGPFVQIWIRISDDRITDAAYRTHGCPSSVAAASLLCDLVRGRTVTQAHRLTGDDLLLVLGGLPEGKGYLPRMAEEALHAALIQGGAQNG